MSLKEIAVHAQMLLTILGSIFNIILFYYYLRGAYVTSLWLTMTIHNNLRLAPQLSRFDHSCLRYNLRCTYI